MKVLILSCNTGGGHNAAAKAIAKELDRRGIENCTVNALDFSSTAKKNFIENGHSFMYKHAPKLYGAAYERSENQKNSWLSLEFAVDAIGLAEYISENAYDTAICVHEIPALMLTDARKFLKLNIRQYFVATDYSVVPGLEKTQMDGYFIPRDFRTQFMEKGIPEEKLIESGIPIDPFFYQRIDKKEARKIIGVRDDIPLILLSAGSIGCGPIRDLAVHMKELAGGKSIIAVLCGNNKTLQKELAAEITDGLFVPVGFTDKVRYWMAAADIMFTKAGGLTSTEAVSMGIPLIFMNAVPGLEAHNLDYFVSRGCGLTADTVEGLCQTAKGLFLDQARKDEMLMRQKEQFSQNAVALLIDTIYAARI